MTMSNKKTYLCLYICFLENAKKDRIFLIFTPALSHHWRNLLNIRNVLKISIVKILTMN